MPAQPEVGGGVDQCPVAGADGCGESLHLGGGEIASFVDDHRRKRDPPARGRLDEAILLGQGHDGGEQVIETLGRVRSEATIDERDDKRLDVAAGDSKQRLIPEARNQMGTERGFVAIFGPPPKRHLLIEIGLGPRLKGDARGTGVDMTAARPQQLGLGLEAAGVCEALEAAGTLAPRRVSVADLVVAARCFPDGWLNPHHCFHVASLRKDPFLVSKPPPDVARSTVSVAVS